MKIVSEEKHNVKDLGIVIPVTDSKDAILVFRSIIKYLWKL